MTFCLLLRIMKPSKMMSTFKERTTLRGGCLVRLYECTGRASGVGVGKMLSWNRTKPKLSVFM